MAQRQQRNRRGGVRRILGTSLPGTAQGRSWAPRRHDVGPSAGQTSWRPKPQEPASPDRHEDPPMGGCPLPAHRRMADQSLGTDRSSTGREVDQRRCGVEDWKSWPARRIVALGSARSGRKDSSLRPPGSRHPKTECEEIGRRGSRLSCLWSSTALDSPDLVWVYCRSPATGGAANARWFGRPFGVRTPVIRHWIRRKSA